MAGHSHWSTIKRAKGANDAKRGKLWSKIARKLITAARSGGGDPRENLALRYVIDEGRAVNMPKLTMEKAILKGTGELGGDNYEENLYEGYGVGGVAFLVDCLTNNRARTAGELRKIFEVNGGNFATSGSVAFQFAKTGIIIIKTDAVDEDRLMELALDAGAEDVRNQGEVYEIITAPTALHKVKDVLAAADLAIEDASISNVPQATVAVAGDSAARIQKLIDALEDNDDVQTVSHNADFPAEQPA
jgi:YebC/PmpR family DNA-binding regulatory protein